MEIKRVKKGIYRFYQIDEETELPSVTTVLGMLPKPAIIYWAIMNTIKFLSKQKKATKKVSSQAYVFHRQLLNSLAEEGTLIHDAIEEYLKTGEQVVEKYKAIDRFKKFEEEAGFKVDKIEHVVWAAEDYKSAGTADLIGRCSDIPIVIDIKTSKAIRLSHKIQATVYKDMYCWQNDIDKEEYRSGVLLIPRDKKRVWKFHINDPDEEEIYRQLYRALSFLFHTLLDLDELDLT